MFQKITGEKRRTPVGTWVHEGGIELQYKKYFISEIVFYSGNHSFCREKLVEIPVFRWKRPFCEKNTSFNTENEVFL